MVCSLSMIERVKSVRYLMFGICIQFTRKHYDYVTHFCNTIPTTNHNKQHKTFIQHLTLAYYGLLWIWHGICRIVEKGTFIVLILILKTECFPFKNEGRKRGRCCWSHKCEKARQSVTRSKLHWKPLKWQHTR